MRRARPVKKLPRQAVINVAVAKARLPELIERATGGEEFDRLLIVQARIESLTLVSRDPALRLYDARVVWG
jgi:PIN domain nuclease of toxin-antitoxin system